MTCRYGKSREVVRRRRVLAIRRVSSSGRMFAKSLSALPLSDTNQPRQHARDTRAEPDASLGPHRASPRTSHSPEPGTGRAASARPLSLGLLRRRRGRIRTPEWSVLGVRWAMGLCDEPCVPRIGGKSASRPELLVAESEQGSRAMRSRVRERRSALPDHACCSSLGSVAGSRRSGSRPLGTSTAPRAS